MKCKNQYGWQEVLTCKQRWMTGSSRSWNPRWLNFLWSYFRQVELSVKFKVKYWTIVESISVTHSCNANVENLKVFHWFTIFNVIKCHTVLSDHVTLTMCFSRSCLGTWAAGHGLWIMCFLTWADHVDSLLGIVETHCHTHIGYFSW